MDRQVKPSLRYVEIVIRILFFLALLIQREDQSPSPSHSKPVPPPKIRQEYTEEKGEKTIQESHEKKVVSAIIFLENITKSSECR